MFNVKEPGFETVIRILSLNAETWTYLSNFPCKSCSCQNNDICGDTGNSWNLAEIKVGDFGQSSDIYGETNKNM